MYKRQDQYYAYLLECLSIYGVQILVGALLSAVTIFRREMSCNRVFHQEKEEENTDQESWERAILQAHTEEVLEGAGMYCSGKSIQALLTLWISSSLPQSEDNDDDRACNYQQQEAKATVPVLRQDCQDVTDLLDHAGNYCSGEPLLAATMAALYLCLLYTSPSPRD